MQETRINDIVDCKLNNFKFYFAGKKGKERRLNGVGFAVDLEIDSATTEFHQIDDRIAWLGGTWWGQPMAIFSVYAPTQALADVDPQLSEDFYRRLIAAIKALPSCYAENF